jgi:hypothetical protein
MFDIDSNFNLMAMENLSGMNQTIIFNIYTGRTINPLPSINYEFLLRDMGKSSHD